MVAGALAVSLLGFSSIIFAKQRQRNLRRVEAVKEESQVEVSQAQAQAGLMRAAYMKLLGEEEANEARHQGASRPKRRPEVSYFILLRNSPPALVILAMIQEVQSNIEDIKSKAVLEAWTIDFIDLLMERRIGMLRAIDCLRFPRTRQCLIRSLIKPQGPELLARFDLRRMRSAAHIACDTLLYTLPRNRCTKPP